MNPQDLTQLVHRISHMFDNVQEADNGKLRGRIECGAQSAMYEGNRRTWLT
jgi:hypothetical protein